MPANSLNSGLISAGRRGDTWVSYHNQLHGGAFKQAR
jgi:hypothetical protein